MGAQKAKKFFSLPGKAANLGLFRQKMNSRTHSDLAYDTIYRPQRDVDNQNGYGCDARLGADWKGTLGSQSDDGVDYKRYCSQ